MLPTLSPFPLPDNLPVPRDDGAADHLPGWPLPDLDLRSTDGELVNLSQLAGWTVVFCYPMTGRPGVALPQGWDEIPGARGCTPQACAFRDSYGELRAAGIAHLYGLSTQTTEYQREMAERLHLPFPVLSDAGLALTRALRLPTFEVEGRRLLKRLTVIAHDGVIRKANYPVFPSNEDATRVLEWFRNSVTLTSSSD